MSITEAPKAVIIGTSSQLIADCLAGIDTTLQSARKRPRNDDINNINTTKNNSNKTPTAADGEDETLEYREQLLRQQLQTLSEFIVSFGSQLVPIAERIARTIVNAIVTRHVPLNETWEAAALFCAYFPSAGSSILTEVFELFLQSNTLWMPTLLGLQYTTVTPRLEALADMIVPSVQYVEASLAQRFASFFTAEATDIAIYRRCQVMGGQTVIVLPHAVNAVFTALLCGLRPCPPSLVAECNDRVSGLRGNSYSLHSTYPRPAAANRAPSLLTGGVVAGRSTNSDSVQLSPLPLPFLGAYKLAQESAVRLRAVLSQVLHPRSQPFYQPPATTVVDVLPIPSAASVAAAAAANNNMAMAMASAAAAAVPTVVTAPVFGGSNDKNTNNNNTNNGISAAAPTTSDSQSAAPSTSSAALHPALGGAAAEKAPSAAVVTAAAATATAPSSTVSVATPTATTQQPNTNNNNAKSGAAVSASVHLTAPKIEDLPDIEF